MKKILIASVLALAVIAVVVGTAMNSAARPETEEVAVAKPERRDILNTAIASGTIMPREEIAIKSRVSGVLDELYVQPGMAVEANQLVAKIRILPEVLQLSEAEAELDERRLEAEESARQLAQQKQLFSAKLVPSDTLKTYQHAHDLNLQKRKAAERKLELIRVGSLGKGKGASNLVYATAAGMVLDLPVARGAFVVETNTFNEGTTIATIADMKHLVFEGFVDESEVGALTQGMTMKLRVGALSQQPLQATLEYIAPKSTLRDGAVRYRVRAALADQGERFLRAGYSANAEIILERREAVLSINEKDLIFEKGATFVELHQSDGSFKRHPVQTGLSDGIYVEILEGLNADQSVRQL